MARDSFGPITRPSLLARVRDTEDQEAWSEFVDIYTPMIYGFARRLGLQDCDARDVVQNVFAQFWLYEFEYQPQRGRFRAWLGTVTRNAVARFYRSHKRPGAAAGGHGPEAFAQLPAAEIWDEHYTAYLFQTALARVRNRSDQQKWDAFAAVWLEDREPALVAEELGRDRAWIYKAKYTILRELNNEVEYLAADVAALARQ